MAYRPREGYSEEAMKSREHLLAQARDALVSDAAPAVCCVAYAGVWGR